MSTLYLTAPHCMDIHPTCFFSRTNRSLARHSGQILQSSGSGADTPWVALRMLFDAGGRSDTLKYL